MDYLFFVLVGLVGSLASSIFGFGTALLVISIGSHILPIKEAIALSTVLFTASTLTKTLLYRNFIDWKVVGIMALSCLPFAYLGSQILAVFPADGVRRLLGTMVLIYLLLKNTKLMPKFRIGTKGLITGSALYGFISGFLGSGNLIKVIMFREMTITKEAFVGAMAATSVMSNFVKLGGYWNAGLFHTSTLWPCVGLVISAVSAVLIGKMVLTKITIRSFETGVNILLAIAATALLI